MLKKCLFIGGFITALSACDSPEVNNGPYNASVPNRPPPAPEFTPQWSFTSEEEVTSGWTVEYNKPGSGDAQASEIEWHDTEYALEVRPYWGGTDVAKLDSVTVYGTLDEPVDLEYGAIYMSIYYPTEHLGNPWGTGPYWGEAAHHMGTQYLVIDSNGNRAKLDAGNGSDWINSFDIGDSDYQRTDPEARGDDEPFDDNNTKGMWFDLKIESGVTYFENDDNASAFDLTSVVGVGVIFNYALEKPDLADHATEGASDKYLYIDNVAVVPFVGEPPTEELIPPPALEELPEFGLPVFRESYESWFNNSWPGSGGTWNDAYNLASKSGTTSIALTFEEPGAVFKIGGPEETLDLSTVTTFDFSAWIAGTAGQGTTKLFVSMCDCDDGIEVVLEEGAWNNISIPVADFGKEALYGAIRIKNHSSGSRMIYLDDIGFDKVPDVEAPKFALPVYFDEAPVGDFSAWDGWGGTYEFASQNRFETGSSAIEVSYEGGWGSMQIGAASVPVSDHATLHFSAYMPEAQDTEETTLLVQLCGGDSVGCGDDDGVQVSVTAGEWVRFTLAVSDFPQYDGSPLSEIRFKNYTDAGKVIYLDNIGFDANYSPEFGDLVFGDTVGAGYSQWDGWGGTYNFESEDWVNSGMYNIGAVFDEGSWGAIQFGASDVDISTYSDFNLSVYVPEGTGESNIQLQLCGGGQGCEDSDGAFRTANDGWNHFSVPISDFSALPADNILQEMRIKNGSADGKTLYFDDIGFDAKPMVVLDLPVYYDEVATASGFSKWDGWGGVYDLEQSETLFHGYKAAQFAYDGGYGSMQFGVSSVDVSTMESFNFAAVAEEGVESTTLLIQLCGENTDETCGDNSGVQVTVTDAGWQSFTLNMEDFPAITDNVLTEIRIKNYTDASKTVYLDSIGFVEQDPAE